MTEQTSNPISPWGERIDDSALVPRTCVRGYEPTRVLGRGGCAIVYEAKHPQHGLVALKIADAPVHGEEGKRRLLKEAEIETRISHPNVIRVFDVGLTDDGRPFVVMERLDGLDLESVLLRVRQLPLDVACAVALQTLDALEAVHARGIVHRDLKPTNLFLAFPPDAAPVVKLIDFGAAHDRRGQRLTKTGMVVGTPIYLAPEQARGGDIDHRVDLWALGVVLHELLTGESPVAAESLSETIATILYGNLPSIRDVRPDVPRAIAEVVSRAMSRDPNARYASAAAMRSALVAAVRASGITASPATLEPIRSEHVPTPSRPYAFADAPTARPRRSDPPPARPIRPRRLHGWRAYTPSIGLVLVGLGLLLHAAPDSSAPLELGRIASVETFPGAIATRPHDEAKIRDHSKIEADPATAQAEPVAPGSYGRGLVEHARLACAMGLYRFAYHLYRRATEVAPRNAAAWGGLSRTAALIGHRFEARLAMRRYRTLARLPDRPIGP